MLPGGHPHGLSEDGGAGLFTRSFRGGRGGNGETRSQWSLKKLSLTPAHPLPTWGNASHASSAPWGLCFPPGHTQASVLRAGPIPLAVCFPIPLLKTTEMFPQGVK